MALAVILYYVIHQHKGIGAINFLEGIISPLAPKVLNRGAIVPL